MDINFWTKSWLSALVLWLHFKYFTVTVSELLHSYQFSDVELHHAGKSTDHHQNNPEAAFHFSLFLSVFDVVGTK